ncbi:hypothetical protein [Mesonia sp.]|uniref:hypothetical protein n=1 Tax=Mesonia sp. TaxID=1960830 RepID=UPI003F9A0A29
MNKQELAELLKYSSPKQLYVVTWNNLLQLLSCPFKVQVKHAIGDLKQSETAWVDEVKITQDLTTVFVIKGRAYFYYHFEILIEE